MKKINIIAYISLIYCSMTTHLCTMEQNPTNQKNEDKIKAIMAYCNEISSSLREIKDSTQQFIKSIESLEIENSKINDAKTNNLTTAISASCSAIIAETDAFQKALHNPK